MWRTTGGYSTLSDFVKVSLGFTKTGSNLFVGSEAKKMLMGNVN